MLHLVSENTDKDRVNYGVERGSLVAIARGIYVNADDDADQIDPFDQGLEITERLHVMA